MPNYRRVRVPGGTYSFTGNLLERRRVLLVEHVETLHYLRLGLAVMASVLGIVR